MNDRNNQTKPLNISREDLSTVPKMVSWEAPANIALIKYWGKKGNQIPITPSLSMTLSAARTNMEVHYSKAKNTEGNISFRFNREKNGSFANRIKQALTNFNQLKQAFTEGDFNKFSETVENEALSLHALMLASNPGFILLNEGSLQIIEKIKAFRQNTGARVTFTLDAGPNVHLLYPTEEKESIRNCINAELKVFCENGKIIHDFTGKGPERLDKNVHV